MMRALGVAVLKTSNSPAMGRAGLSQGQHQLRRALRNKAITGSEGPVLHIRRRIIGNVLCGAFQ